MKLTQTSTMVNLRISRNKSRRISTESSERTDHLRTDDSTTSVDSEVYESTIKGTAFSATFGNIIVKASFSENILNCSNISEGGLPESSVAQSAINIGCQIIDVNNDISHKTRNGKMHLTVEHSLIGLFQSFVDTRQKWFWI